MLQSAVAEKSLCAWQTLFDMVGPFNYTHNSRRGSNALREKFFRIVPLPCEGNKSGVEEQSQSELIADTIWYGPCNLAPTITNRWGYIPEGSYILWREDMWEAFISCVTKDPPSTFSSAKVSTMLPLRDLIFSHNPVSELIGHEVRALEKGICTNTQRDSRSRQTSHWHDHPTTQGWLRCAPRSACCSTPDVVHKQQCW